MTSIVSLPSTSSSNAPSVSVEGLNIGNLKVFPGARLSPEGRAWRSIYGSSLRGILCFAASPPELSLISRLLPSTVPSIFTSTSDSMTKIKLLSFNARSSSASVVIRISFTWPMTFSLMKTDAYDL